MYPSAKKYFFFIIFLHFLFRDSVYSTLISIATAPCVQNCILAACLRRLPLPYHGGLLFPGTADKTGHWAHACCCYIISGRGLVAVMWALWRLQAPQYSMVTRPVMPHISVSSYPG